METTVLAEEPVKDLKILEHTDAPLRTHISHGRGRGRGGTPQNLIIYGAIDAERSDATNTHEIIPALKDSDDMNPRSVTAPPEAKRSRISALGVAVSAPPNGVAAPISAPVLPLPPRRGPGRPPGRRGRAAGGQQDAERKGRLRTLNF
jgi:hypothetical protein